MSTTVVTPTSQWGLDVIARFEQRTPRSREAFEHSRQLVPGGVPAGLGFMSPYPLYVERGDGAYVWDADGNRMLDLMAGDWLLPLGHCHPEVLAATISQLQRGTTYCSPHPTLGADFAALLSSRLPSIERIRFTASGTEATQTALRLAPLHREAAHRQDAWRLPRHARPVADRERSLRQP